MSQHLFFAVVLAISTPTVTAQCHANFITELKTATSSLKKCGILSVFKTCVSDLDNNNVEKSKEERELRSATLLIGSSENCEQFEATSATIKTNDANVEISVPNGKDVRFIQSQRQAVSIFGLADQVAGLPKTLASNLTTIKSELTTITDAQKLALDTAIIELKDDQATIKTKVDGLGKIFDDKNMQLKLALMQVINSKGAATQTALTTLESAISSLNNSIKKSLTPLETCALIGKVLIDGKCLSPNDVAKTIVCAETADIGVQRYNSSLKTIEVCQQGGQRAVKNTSFAWEPLLITPYERIPTNTLFDPFTSGSHILRLVPTAKSGLYWLRPIGEDVAVQTECDFDKYKGFCLAAYAHNCAVSTAGCNQLFPQLNTANGKRWKEAEIQNRHGQSGVIALKAGAKYFARGASRMLMTASHNAAVQKGDANAYQYVYHIDLQNRQQAITFQRHGKRFLRNDCSTLNVAPYDVTCKKGCGGRTNVVQSRSAFVESLGITWSDEHPTGYGFSETWGRAPCQGAGNWADGPFFPSQLQGAGPYYAHQGWYGMFNGEYNRKGAMAIWFN